MLALSTHANITTITILTIIMKNIHNNSNNTHNSIHAEKYVCDVHVHLLLYSAHMDATKLVAAVHGLNMVRVLACQAGGRGFKSIVSSSQ